MTRIDFYVLNDENPVNRLLLVCKLAEKAYRHHHPVFIHADDDAVLSELDEKLWAFRSDCFVPHRLLEKDELADTINNDPVQLSTGVPAADRKVLINMAAQVPAFFSRFERALEVVNQSSDIRDTGRNRYKFYQQRGYPLHHHKM